MFSVVVPLYNKHDHIVECLRSVLNQGSLVDELIVIDDGSTDGSGDLVEREFGKAVRLVRQPNAGVAVARNHGISLAQNDLVCLLDADDAYEIGFVEEMRALVEAYPAAVFFSCAFSTQDAALGLLDPPTGLPVDFFGAPPFLETFARSFGIICSSSVCVRRSIVQGVGGFPAGKISGEDIETWFRMSREGAFGFSAKRLARIRRDEGGDKFLNRMLVLPSHIEWLAAQLRAPVSLPDEAVIRRLFRKFVLVNGVLAAAQGNRSFISRLRGLARRADWLAFLALCLIQVTPKMVAARARALHGKRRSGK